MLAAASLGMALCDDAAAKPTVLGGTFSGSLTAATDYVSRGLSNSDKHPTLQGILEYNHKSGIYLGAFASNVDFDDDNNAKAELDVWGGWGFTWRGLTLAADALWYYYPGLRYDMSDEFNTFELEGLAEYNFGFAALGFQIAYSPNYFFDSDDSFYYSLEISVPVLSFLALEAHVGHQDVQENAVFGLPDYNDWSVGLAATWRSLKFGLHYVDTDVSQQECFAGKSWCEARAVASLVYSF